MGAMSRHRFASVAYIFRLAWLILRGDQILRLLVALPVCGWCGETPPPWFIDTVVSYQGSPVLLSEPGFWYFQRF